MLSYIHIPPSYSSPPSTILTPIPLSSFSSLLFLLFLLLLPPPFYSFALLLTLLTPPLYSYSSLLLTLLLFTVSSPSYSSYSSCNYSSYFPLLLLLLLPPFSSLHIATYPYIHNKLSRTCSVLTGYTQYTPGQGPFI